MLGHSKFGWKISVHRMNGYDCVLYSLDAVITDLLIKNESQYCDCIKMRVFSDWVPIVLEKLQMHLEKFNVLNKWIWLYIVSMYRSIYRPLDRRETQVLMYACSDVHPSTKGIVLEQFQTC